MIRRAAPPRRWLRRSTKPSELPTSRRPGCEGGSGPRGSARSPGGPRGLPDRSSGRTSSRWPARAADAPGGGHEARSRGCCAPGPTPSSGSRASAQAAQACATGRGPRTADRTWPLRRARSGPGCFRAARRLAESYHPRNSPFRFP
jgi:hypothetical protein